MTFDTEAKGWKKIVQGRWVIFDADAIISILSFGQHHIFKELTQKAAGLIYIHPVLLELMNSNSAKEQLTRSKMLVDYDFIELPLTINEFRLAYKIQKSLPVKSTPSPTDLYLGATLAKHHKGNRLLLTANIKDFPLPLYTREGSLLLQNDTNIKLLSFLCVNQNQLVEEQ